MTWSKYSSIRSAGGKRESRCFTSSSIAVKNADPARPCVQLNIRIRELVVAFSFRAFSDQDVTYRGTPAVHGRPTPGLTYHSIQHARLSVVWAPSRCQVIFEFPGSDIVWQRPGHLTFFKPSRYSAGIVDASLFSNLKSVRTAWTARLALPCWCVPARPVMFECTI